MGGDVVYYPTWDAIYCHIWEGVTSYSLRWEGMKFSIALVVEDAVLLPHVEECSIAGMKWHGFKNIRFV